MKARRLERGMALVTALLIVAILVTVVVEFVYSVYGHSRSTRLYAWGWQSSVLASSVVEAEAARLGNIYGDGSAKYAYLSIDERARRITGADGAEATIVVEDEQGKIALNQMAAQSGELVPERFELFKRLLANLGLPEELAYAVVDWIDADDDLREGGAENAYYNELKPAYAPKNAPLYSVEELLLVKGFDADIVKRLKPFVTVYTDGLININSAPKEVIMALDKEISVDMAESVIAARDSAPFESVAKIRELPGFGALPVGFEGKLVTKSSTFRIESAGSSSGARRFVEAVFKAAPSTGGAPFKTLYWRER